MFKPKTRKKTAGKSCLFIINRYKNYIQADFITHYIKNGINLLIISSHYSHFI